MKSIKSLVLIFLVATVAAISAGNATANATVLCESASNPCTSKYSLGVTLHGTLKASHTWRLFNVFKATVCVSATLHADITVAIPPKFKMTTSSAGGCDCEEKTLAGGTLEVSYTSGGNGVVTSSGTEITTTCSTAFGNVHCIYATSSTSLGTLTGGNPAVIDVNSASIPRLPTNPLCGEKAELSAEYEVDTPTPLYVEPE